MQLKIIFSKYILDPLAKLNKFHYVAEDESLFIHEENQQTWMFCQKSN